MTTSTTVDFGPYVQTFVLASSDDSSGTVAISFTVPTATTSYLTFTSNTPGVEGAVLDNVSITESTSAVPEPAAFLLAGLGILGVAVRSRKMRGSGSPTA